MMAPFFLSRAMPPDIGRGAGDAEGPEMSGETAAGAAQFKGPDAKPARIAALARMMTHISLIIALALFPALAHAQSAGAEGRLPLFRHIDVSLGKLRGRGPERLRFLLSDDFPPFTYRNRQGAITGYAVAVAQAICRQAHLRCQFVVRPFSQLASELLANRGDVIISGIRPTPDNWKKLDFTRPIFKAAGRFATHRESAMRQAGHGSLVGRRVAVAKGSVHAHWLRQNMVGVRVVLKRDFAAATAALKERKVDALFGDWLQVAFFVAGEQAGSCCRTLPGLFVDRAFAWNHLSMALRPGERDLRNFLDRQLDMLQEDGELRIIARRFLPLHLDVPASPKQATTGDKKTISAGTKEVKAKGNAGNTASRTVEP